MNKVFFIFVLLLPTLTYSKLTEETCRQIVEHSKIVLLNKQKGVSIDEMLNKNDEWFKDSSRLQKEHANLTIETAYSLPSFSDPKLNQAQLNEFMSYQYLNCKIAMRK